MRKIISRRDFLTNGLIVSGTLLAQACAPKSLKPSNILASLTPVPSIHPKPTKTSEPTADPYPPIEPTTWAEKTIVTSVREEKLKGTTDPELMFRYVGDWFLKTPEGTFLESSKTRAIDMVWMGMQLAFVGDTAVPQNETERNNYRSNIAERLNGQTELKKQLSDIMQKLPSINLSPERMTIVINGPEFSQNTANYIPGLNENNAKITGIAAYSEILADSDMIPIILPPKWLSYDSQNLSLMKKEDSPMLKPLLMTVNGRICRTDTGVPEETMQGLNFGDFHLVDNTIYRSKKVEIHLRLQDWESKIRQMKEAGGNFATLHLDRTRFTDPSYYQELERAIALARNKYGIRMMIEEAWDSSLGDVMIRTPSPQLVEDWSYFVNNNHIDSYWNFGSFLRRNVDIFDILGEPFGEVSFFNQYLKAASDEVKKVLGADAITGISNGKWFATGAVELMFAGQDGVSNAVRFQQEYPGSAAVIHPFKLDNWKYEKQDLDPLNDQRPDPMTYVIQLMDKNVPVIFGEVGLANEIENDWILNPEWLKQLFDFCFKNRIPYAINGDLKQIAPIWKEQRERSASGGLHPL